MNADEVDADFAAKRWERDYSEGANAGRQDALRGRDLSDAERAVRSYRWLSGYGDTYADVRARLAEIDGTVAASPGGDVKGR